MSSENYSSASDKNLAEITKDENGNVKLPEERLKSAGKLRSILSKFREEDKASARNRAKVQNLKDYKPPLDKALLAKAGQAGRFNINFGELASICNDAAAAYVDNFESPEHLVPVRLKKGAFDPQDTVFFERIMSDEFTKLIRGWDSGYFEYLMMVDYFVTHGISIGYFADRHTWQYSAAGLSDFMFPRKTKASSDSIEICICEGQLGQAKLSDIIQNESVAEDGGWNVAAVKDALLSDSEDLYDEDNPEDLQEMAKANDLGDVSGEFTPISVVYAWVKEHDGTVSYYICTKETKTDDYSDEGTSDREFLYKKRNAYKNFGEAMQIFPFYTGNAGNIYTIRGLGYMAYPQGMASNLMQSSLLDSARDSMSVKYIAPGEREINNIPIVNAGPATFIPPHLQIVDKQYQPDLQRSAMPALELLQQQMDRKSASSSMSSVFNNKQDRRSAAEVTSALEHFNSLNSAAMLLWSRPWRALLTESVRRAFDPTQDESQECGRLAKLMQDACVERGLPAEAFEAIDLHETKVGIPVGAGSKSARAAQFEIGGQLYQNMDDVGRQNFDRDRAIHGFGVEGAKRYFNFEDIERDIIDERIAILETNDLQEGVDIEPSNAEVHIVHLRVHIQKLSEEVQAVEEGQMELLDFTNRNEKLYAHCEATMQATAVPDQQNDELEMYQQQIQQIGEYLNNGIREREKMMREQQEQEAQGGGGGEEDSKAQIEQLKLQVKQQEAEIAIQKKQTENQLDAEKKSREIAHIDMLHKQKMVQQQAEAMQKMQLEDAKTASAIKRK